VEWNECELFEGTLNIQNYAARLVLDVPRRTNFKIKYFVTNSRRTKLCKHTLPGNSSGFRGFVSWSMIPKDIKNLALLGRFKVQVKQDRHTLFTCANDL